ncbi:NADH dehydrogenase subunit 1 [Aphelenchoides avenae]|nr:NADH dehydrogenase subunit 1 [Aphelenchus avenae]
MGQFYDKPARQGDSPFTRSGLPPPKLKEIAKTDKPTHRFQDRMSLELHMADERVRTAGLSDAEREWRHKWLKDQHLHPDEPIHVDAVHRQLNPVRILYRWPWDTLYKRFLLPTFGVYHGALIRMTVPKLLMLFLGFEVGWYLYKYEMKDWEHQRGFFAIPTPMIYDKKGELEEKSPGTFEKGITQWHKLGYNDGSFEKRVSHLNLGPPSRPW